MDHKQSFSYQKLPPGAPLLRQFCPTRSGPASCREAPFRWRISPNALRAAPRPPSELAAPVPTSAQTCAPQRSLHFRRACSSPTLRVLSPPADRCCPHLHPRAPPRVISEPCPAVPESHAWRSAQSMRLRRPAPPQSSPLSSALYSSPHFSTVPRRVR